MNQKQQGNSNQKPADKESDLALHVESLVEVDNPDDFAFEGEFHNQTAKENTEDRKQGFTRFDNPDDIDANMSKS